MATIHPTPPDPSGILWSIEQLADKANEALTLKHKAPDSRLTAQLTVRNLRRLVSQGAIDSASRVGRDAYYGPKHLEQVLAARELMSQGFTSSSIQTLRNASAPQAFYSEPQPNPFLAEPLASPTAWGESLTLDNSRVESETSTASALNFLAQVSPRSADESKSWSSKTIFDKSANNTQAPSPSAPSLPGSWGAASASSSSTSIHDKAGLAKAYQTLGATKPAQSSRHANCMLVSSMEAEPLPGLRLIMRSHSCADRLTEEQKTMILLCADQLWEAAKSPSSSTLPKD